MTAPDRCGVVVIGGGLAGISAAVDLVAAGLPVTLVEERPWLGGATCSFARRGLVIDNGQHAFLRCFTAYQELLAVLGVTSSCAIQDGPALTVLSGAGRSAPGAGAGRSAAGRSGSGDSGEARRAIFRRSVFRRPVFRPAISAGPVSTTAGLVRPAFARLTLADTVLPPPLRLAGAVATYGLLSPAQRLLAAPAALALWFAGRTRRGDQISLGRWLRQRGQPEQVRRMFWDLLTVPVLNVAGDEASLSLAAAAIRSAALAAPDGADIGVPEAPLSALHGAPAAELLAAAGAQIRLGVSAVAVSVAAGGGYDIELTGGQPALGFDTPEVIRADGVVLAVPPWAAAALAPEQLLGDAARWARLQPSPIVSIHVVYDSEVTTLPFAPIVGAPAHWVVDKTRSAGLHAGQYLAMSVPAADAYVDVPASALRQEFLPLLERLFPAAARTGIADFFVTRERRATVRQSPGSQQLRARQAPGLPGLALAGAWTAAEWPDSMEGAVRSGHSAAGKLISELAVPGWVGPARIWSGTGVGPG